jgi:hypothetical protein
MVSQAYPMLCSTVPCSQPTHPECCCMITAWPHTCACPHPSAVVYGKVLRVKRHHLTRHEAKAYSRVACETLPGGVSTHTCCKMMKSIMDVWLATYTLFAPGVGRGPWYFTTPCLLRRLLHVIRCAAVQCCESDE